MASCGFKSTLITKFHRNCIFLFQKRPLCHSFGFTKKGQLLKVAAPGAFFKIVVAVCITPRDHNSPFRELEARWICFSKPFKTDFWPGYKSLVGRTIADNPKENNAHIAIKMDSKLFKTRGVCMKAKEEWE